MKIADLKLQTPDDAESVFYEAFRNCDAQIMNAIWAEGDVICIHPGSSAIVGHDAVVRSWFHIFDGANFPDIKVKVTKRTISGKLAVHFVTEEIASGTEFALVLCTNVYQKFSSGWFMIEHHATSMPSFAEVQTLQ